MNKITDTKNGIVADMSFERDIKHIVNSAREYSYRAANLMQVASNWLLGWRIVEQEQHGERRAEYGKRVIEQASKVLTEEFGKGFSETTLRAYRLFYQTFPNLQIQQALPAEFKMLIEQIQRTVVAESDDRNHTLRRDECRCRAFLLTRDQQADVRVEVSDIYAFFGRIAPRDRTTERNI